jgi:hypothetical protein
VLSRERLDRCGVVGHQPTNPAAAALVWHRADKARDVLGL